MRETTDQLGEELRAAVERQLQQSELQDVTNAVERLIEQGHSRDTAIDTVGAILLEEIHDMMTEHTMFDRERYIARLDDL